MLDSGEYNNKLLSQNHGCKKQSHKVGFNFFLKMACLFLSKNQFISNPVFIANAIFLNDINVIALENIFLPLQIRIMKQVPYRSLPAKQFIYVPNRKYFLLRRITVGGGRGGTSLQQNKLGSPTQRSA